MAANTASIEVNSLLGELRKLHESCLEMERDFEASIGEACVQSRHSVQNLVHYLALRKHDLRRLQSRLAALGLSSLGRNESSSLAGVEAVIAVLEALAGENQFSQPHHKGCVDFETGSAALARQAEHLLGPAPDGRAVRVMVTMPSEAAHSFDLVRLLVDTGMDVMRVNCAHDAEPHWEAMIAHLRRANQECGKQCKVLMDLAGPKLRTGPIARGYRVARWKINKDARGEALNPARILLVPKNALQPGPDDPPADLKIPVSKALLQSIQVGDTVAIHDSRKRKRELTVIEKSPHNCLCVCDQSAYVLSGGEISVTRDGSEVTTGRVGDLPFVEEPLHLHSGNTLVLTKFDHARIAGHRGKPHVSCTLPEVFSTAEAGQPIFFDDGKIEGRIREVHPDHMLVEIVHAGANGAKLGSSKGINLPETDLGINAMTEKDRRDLDFIAAHADIVGLSFVRQAGDVMELQQELAARGKSSLGIILKIESQQGFDELPRIMIAALRHYPVGIMVARGDLAIEVGFERLAEVQEEILWLSEAAHIPVIWATQVLETLAKTGMPSRAEVTDAAMGVRAECVMLNKGEHIVDAVRFLDHVLQRMQAHQMKKRSMLRRLAVAEVSNGAVHAV